MCDLIGFILSGSEIYYDLHHNIIEIFLMNWNISNFTFQGPSIIKITSDESHNPLVTPSKI